MNAAGIRPFVGIVVGWLIATTLPNSAMAQEAEFCPCGFASAVRARSLSGGEMNCTSLDVDIANVPPHGVLNKQNTFFVRHRNKKGAVTSSNNFYLNEQGLLAADADNIARYAPTCMVTKAGKRRVRILDAAYILTPGEYEACASDLTAFVASVTATASNAPVTTCEDQTGNGIADVWEPLQPVTQPFCYNEFGQAIQCP